MIAYLKGQVLDLGEDHLVLETHGVGYQVFATPDTLAAVTGGEAQLHIYTHIREDALVLYGFLRKVEKSFFLALIKINGVGPKMALSILSAATVERLKEMVDEGDLKGLTSLPKVGKKTAEQMILGLKGQLVMVDTAAAPKASKARSEIAFALCNLGFRAQDVDKVVQQLEPGMDVSEGIRAGLKALSQL